MQASVIICSHNPRADYLARTLDSLRAQTLPNSAWELLLIDNASNRPLAGAVDLSWHANARIVHEKELGLSNARIRGISESKGEIIVFVDDDNVLDPEYLVQSLRIAAAWPQLGIWGGSIVPEFETPPPQHLEPHLSCLAIREVHEPRCSKTWDCQEAEPRGAGLCLRRGAAEAYRDFYLTSKLRLDDRKGGALSSGGDTEIAFVVCSLGLGMGVFPELKLTHLIPSRRLEESYIARIAEGLETSSMLLFYKWGKIKPPNPFSARQLARFVKHFFFSRGLDRSLALGRLRAAMRARKLIASNGASQ